MSEESRRYRIEHRTVYTYDDDVNDSYGMAHLRPRELPWQHCVSHETTLDPAAADLQVEVDYFGNSRTYFQVTEPHDELIVTGVSIVDVHDPTYDSLTLQWELARPADSADPGSWQASEYVLESDLVDVSEDVRAYAAPSFTSGRPVGDAISDLMHRIHTDFTYEAGATTVTTRVNDVLTKRAGVCQDFAHLTVACLRSMGLAGRYVSGYLATDPPPGRDRIVGADATHAWAACWIPGGGWLAVDPTNDQWVNSRYATIAWGRDYADVPPVKGVIFTESKTSQMTVTVDMAPSPV